MVESITARPNGLPRLEHPWALPQGLFWGWMGMEYFLQLMKDTIKIGDDVIIIALPGIERKKTMA